MSSPIMNYPAASSGVSKTYKDGPCPKGPGMGQLKKINQIRYGIVLSILWTAVASLSLYWNVRHEREEFLTVSRVYASAIFERAATFRNWNSMHGGVYVKVTGALQPNPYMSHMPDRDVRLPSGETLTLINPAYMLRQLSEFGIERDGVMERLTSFRPLNPANLPDEWEAGALRSFKEGATEVTSLSEIKGVEYYRLMKPLLTQKSCLKCHENEGYAIGGMEGGMSVAVPVTKLREAADKHVGTLVAAHAIIWLFGLAGIICFAIRFYNADAERARAEEALTKSATMDALTGVSNRLKFNDIIAREIGMVKRYSNKLSLLMIDIDGFKQVNDAYGHLAGDAVLKDFAGLVNGMIREVDSLVRWGGEEFIVTLPDTEAGHALLLAERICEASRDHNFEPVGRVTASIGVTECRADDTADTLVTRADDAMYRAKREGGDRAVKG